METMLTIGPELFTLLLIGAFMALALGSPAPRLTRNLALGLAAAGLVICVAAAGQKGILFNAVYRVDLFSQVFKVLLFMGFFMVVCLCGDLKGIEESRHPEFYLLLGTSTLALMMLISSMHLINLYLSLEVSSYSLYILVYLREGRQKGIEAGMKYFLIGATASAVTLFGFALVYGAARTADIALLVQRVPESVGDPLLLAGLLLSLGGFFFKLGLFPFHFWAPDVYEGAANPVAAYIATASKVAAIAIVMRITALAGEHADGLARVLIILSIVSMTMGNLAAIAQQDLKRLLAFSSIAHAGYVLIGIASLSSAGYAGVVFYALAILTMKFTCFLVLVNVADDGRNLDVSHLAGLHRRSPLLALALMLALFGLAGIPPTIGFTGKLLIFMAAMQKGYFFLVLIAMINVVISLYYYLQVLKAAYLLEPDTDLPVIRMPTRLTLLTIGMISLMLIGGLYPNFFITIARTVSEHIL